MQYRADCLQDVVGRSSPELIKESILVLLSWRGISCLAPRQTVLSDGAKIQVVVLDVEQMQTSLGCIAGVGVAGWLHASDFLCMALFGF